MSATVETSTPSWRKRHREDDNSSQMDLKKPRLYYFRLESESSRASEEDTESVYSLQDRETDVVRDTTDTDSKSDSGDHDEYEVIEYEVASLSGSDNDIQLVSSSGSEDMILAAAAAVICDSSLEKWITDGEESDNSSLDESSPPKIGFTTCIQCKSENTNPLYTFCEKCFQSCRQCKKRKTYKGFPLCISCHKDRKRFFPPRPRGHRKSRKTSKKKEPPVKLDLLRSCLSGLSQDSGIGSSQECPPLGLDQIIVPDKHLKAGTSKIPSISDKADINKRKERCNTDLDEVSKTCSQSTNSDIEDVEENGIHKESSSFASTLSMSRKRSFSESSSSDLEVKKPKISEKKITECHTTSNAVAEISSSTSSGFSERSYSGSGISEQSELCIFCNNAPKDGIFLHTNIAHQCCCYKCAKRTLQTIKRCPICNRSVNKVVRIFTS